MKRKSFTKLGVVLILIFCVFSEIIYSNNCLTVTNYNIKTDKTDASFRAVLLSDLHNKEFGRNNHLLLEAVESLKPDIIFVAGDMVTMGDPNTETALNVYRGLAELAPTYCCVGNHERNFESRDTLYRKISETGAHLLQNSMETVAKSPSAGSTAFRTMSFPQSTTQADYFWRALLNRKRIITQSFWLTSPSSLCGSSAKKSSTLC